MLVLLLILYPTIGQHPKEQDLAAGLVSGLHRRVCPPSSSTGFAMDRVVTLYAPVKPDTRFLCCGPEGLNPVGDCCSRLGWGFRLLKEEFIAQYINNTSKH